MKRLAGLSLKLETLGELSIKSSIDNLEEDTIARFCPLGFTPSALYFNFTSKTFTTQAPQLKLKLIPSKSHIVTARDAIDAFFDSRALWATIEGR